MSGEKPYGFQIKGIKEGILITFDEGEWTELQDRLINHIEENTSFFQGAKIVLDVGNKVFHAAEMGSLRDNLSERGVFLWAVLSHSLTTEETARVFGLATRLSSPKTERNIKSIDKGAVLAGENAIFVQKTLRSGISISYQGHIVIMGDVNPGAEINASGSVVVWGRLRGVVHAGSEGDEKSIVCALNMEPAQLRIADKIAVSISRKGKPHPEKAQIKDGQIVAEQWNY
jgi:septum site-determining protein MinC